MESHMSVAANYFGGIGDTGEKDLALGTLMPRPKSNLENHTSLDTSYFKETVNKVKSVVPIDTAMHRTTAWSNSKIQASFETSCNTSHFKGPRKMDESGAALEEFPAKTSAHASPRNLEPGDDDIDEFIRTCIMT